MSLSHCYSTTDSNAISDIHPWDILINGSRWDGKIRLVGFVDVFFLICYSGESRFEKGIIIYSEATVHLDKRKTDIAQRMMYSFEISCETPMCQLPSWALRLWMRARSKRLMKKVEVCIINTQDVVWKAIDSQLTIRTGSRKALQIWEHQGWPWLYRHQPRSWNWSQDSILQDRIKKIRGQDSQRKRLHHEE